MHRQGAPLNNTTNAVENYDIVDKDQEPDRFLRLTLGIVPYVNAVYHALAKYDKRRSSPCPTGWDPRLSYTWRNIMRIVAAPFVVLFLLVFHSAPFAKTYECDAVDNEAKLGISPRSTVAVSADEDDRECKFSVNGAKVSSPPQQQITQAFVALLTNRLLFSGSNWTNDQLAALVLSAGPDTTVNTMSQILGSARPQIRSCIESLLQPRDTSIAFSGSNAQGRCVVTTSQPVTLGPISFRFDPGDRLPVLLLFVQRARLTNLLAIPRR